jgi:hypothetical protein
MPSLDPFAAFAEKYGTVSKSWATRATRATAAQEPQKTDISSTSEFVAQRGNNRATRATQEPADPPEALHVAHVAQVLPKQAAERATPETEENCGFQDSVAHVAHVAHENDDAAHSAIAVAWDAEDWLAFFYERAGIAEENGLQRAEADACALEWTLVEWLNQNPAPSEPGRCVSCGEFEGTGDGIVLPFGTETHGHTWLHSRCWPAWQAQRRKEAAEALAEAGICPPRPT